MIRADAAAKRQHILDTAYVLFKQDGFHATGMDRVIAEAGIAKMTLYRHFPTKEGLIVAVLVWRAERFSQQLDGLAEAARTPNEKIAAIFDWHGRWFSSPGFAGCLFQHALAEFAGPDHPVFKAAACQKDAFRRRIAAILEEMVPADSAASMAAGVSMLIEGATLLARIGQGDGAIRDARRAALSLIATPAASR